MRSVVVAAALVAASLSARADTVSRYLDRSKVEAAFPDFRANYLRVDISDNYDVVGRRARGDTAGVGIRIAAAKAARGRALTSVRPARPRDRIRRRA
jgi:hypothetical protein